MSFHVIEYAVVSEKALVLLKKFDRTFSTEMARIIHKVCSETNLAETAHTLTYQAGNIVLFSKNMTDFDKDFVLFSNDFISKLTRDLCASPAIKSTMYFTAGRYNKEHHFQNAFMRFEEAQDRINALARLWWISLVQNTGDTPIFSGFENTFVTWDKLDPILIKPTFIIKTCKISSPI